MIKTIKCRQQWVCFHNPFASGYRGTRLSRQGANYVHSDATIETLTFSEDQHIFRVNEHLPSDYHKLPHSRTVSRRIDLDRKAQVPLFCVVRFWEFTMCKNRVEWDLLVTPYFRAVTDFSAVLHLIRQYYGLSGIMRNLGIDARWKKKRVVKIIQVLQGMKKLDLLGLWRTIKLFTLGKKIRGRILGLWLRVICRWDSLIVTLLPHFFASCSLNFRGLGSFISWICSRQMII